MADSKCSFPAKGEEGEIPVGYIRLYHYTNAKGAAGIAAHQNINKSNTSISTHAYFGVGTYLTDKAPGKHTKLDIAKDIWVNETKLYDEMMKQGRTDFVFEIVIKKDLVQQEDSEHHIWLYPGADLDLSDHQVVLEWRLEETVQAERAGYESAICRGGEGACSSGVAQGCT